MLHHGTIADLALQTLHRETQARLAPLARRSGARRGIRRRVGRALLAWGSRLAPAEPRGSSPGRLATTMVP